MATTFSLTRIPDDIAANATITYVPDTNKNTSQAGVSGRRRVRPLLRNYVITPSPEYADEMQAITMVCGTDQLLCIKDPTTVANTLVDEIAELSDDGATALIGKNWAPSTGGLSVFERALIIANNFVVVKVDGSVVSSSTYSLGDFGVLTFSPAIPGSVVKVSANYLQVVAMMDSPSSTAFAPGQYQFHDIRLEQVPPAELIRRYS